MAAARNLRHAAPWLMLSPALLILVPFFVLPIAIMFRNSLSRDDPASGMLAPDLTLANYARILSDWFYGQLFFNSLAVSFGVALLTLVIGYPFAYYLARWAGRRWMPVLLWVVYTPILVSVITRVFGWIVITADSGIINSLLLQSGIVKDPVRILFDTSGMMIGMVHRYLPLMILPLANAIAKIDPRVLSASTSLGASGRDTFLRVVVPLSLPGVVAGLQLVTAVVLSDYVLPTLMGSTRFRILAPAVFDEAIGSVRWALAASLAMVMLAIVAVTMLLLNLAMRRVAPWARGL
ncbi:MAG: ABC transporter permease [Betaproteobacteria bacterium]|nr:ABC transporter permease [Betaproteobacteria bacterium]